MSPMRVNDENFCCFINMLLLDYEFPCGGFLQSELMDPPTDRQSKSYAHTPPRIVY